MAKNSSDNNKRSEDKSQDVSASARLSEKKAADGVQHRPRPPVSSDAFDTSDSRSDAQKSQQSHPVVPYDFRSAKRIGPDQMRVLQSLHDGFAANASVALSSLLRSVLDVRLGSVVETSYKNFVQGAEAPTYLNILRAVPAGGNWILEIGPSILFPMIDRLLGGGRDAAPQVRRPLTDIETRLAGRIGSVYLQQLMRAWKSITDLKLETERVESNPQLAQIAMADEPVLVVQLEFALGASRGSANLCMPVASLQRMSEKLDPKRWLAEQGTPASEQSEAEIAHRMRGTVVELVVELANAQLNTSDVLGLRVGDIITTEKGAQSPLAVSVEGTTKFHARAGALKGHKAVEIQQAVAGSGD